MENGKNAVAKTEVKKEIAKTLIFSNGLLGEVELNREKLIASITEEHRSYANHPFTINGQKSFSLPELDKVGFEQGLSLGLVIHLKDNANPEGAKKGKLQI